MHGLVFMLMHCYTETKLFTITAICTYGYSITANTQYASTSYSPGSGSVDACKNACDAVSDAKESNI